MPTRSRFRVAFAEDDNMFRLVETAMLRRPTPRGQRVLDYFLGPEADAGARRLFAAADRFGLGADVQPTVRDGTEPLERYLDDVDVLVVESERIRGEHLERAGKRLKLVLKFGRILDNIDTDRAAELGIVVASHRRATTISCAEHVVTLMLALFRKLIEAHESVTRRLQDPSRPTTSTGRVSTRFNWGGITGVRLVHGQTLGLVGFGEIAREVAVRALALGMDVVYHKRTPVDPVSLAPALRPARQVPLEELLAMSDVVSIHIPSNQETERLIDGAALSAMKPSAVLVNMSRGAIVDEHALEAALRVGGIAGAALDVHREEPVPTDSGLLQLDNVVWTPHMAAGGGWFVIEEVESVVAALARAARGEPPAGDSLGTAEGAR
jgi:phosphoglycerate dehydrogenase-like enzyme